MDLGSSPRIGNCFFLLLLPGEEEFQSLGNFGFGILPSDWELFFSQLPGEEEFQYFEGFPIWDPSLGLGIVFTPPQLLPGEKGVLIFREFQI